MDKIKFSKEYWPQSGSKIIYDISDLWANNGDQLDVFIADSLISNPPSLHVSLNEEGFPVVEVFLWQVGRDCITIEEPLEGLIIDSAKDYCEIFSTEQANDVHQKLKGLLKLKASVEEAETILKNLIFKWEEKSK